MKHDTNNGNDHITTMTKKPVNQQEQDKKKAIPQSDAGNNETNAGGSMSEGNLSNSRYSREKTRSLHDKQFITGSDSDGQAG